jgi:hypothetical protein
METKDILIIVLGILGWLWAIIQFVLTRQNQKKDKALEKRFDVYSSFMNKMDELNQNMRIDTTTIVDMLNIFLREIIDHNEDEINNALLDFNLKLMEFIK